MTQRDVRLGFLAYPWDLLDEGPVQAIDIIVDRCGCDALLLNSNYHSVRVLRPRARGLKTYQLTDAVSAFRPDRTLYKSPSWIPIADRRLADTNVLEQAREACRSRNVHFGLWSVGLHNSSLGRRHPDMCVHSCFGDIYNYALCPSNSEVQAYLRSLVDDLCRQFQPRHVVVEGIGYLGLHHGVHHELFTIPWSETLEMLFSLCFCPACVQRGQEKGVDARRLQVEVTKWATRLISEERGQRSLDFSRSETAALLMDVPDLWGYLQLRADTVTHLVQELREVAHSKGVLLQVIPASFHRPTSRAWLEGASLPELAAACDGLVIPAYFPGPAEVAADLSWAVSHASDSVCAILNAASPDLTTSDTLAEQAAACQTVDCMDIYYYNYGLLTDQRLAWVAQANERIRTGSF